MWSLVVDMHKSTKGLPSLCGNKIFYNSIIEFPARNLQICRGNILGIQLKSTNHVTKFLTSSVAVCFMQMGGVWLVIINNLKFVVTIYYI
jgi:hypothetical protein